MGATYAVHLRLVGKRVIDFLLVIIEHFSLGVMAEALRAIIDWKSAFLNGVGHFGQKFEVEGTSPSNHSSCEKTACIDVSCGIRMLAESSFVLSQYTRLTDRQTDGQTDGQTHGFAIAIPRVHTAPR